MAEGIRYVCNHCHNAIEAWSDGDPYFINQRGRKSYAYHPDPKFELCTGVDSPHLCLSCGARFPVDSAAPIEQCPECQCSEIEDTFHLEGRKCPTCNVGIFRRDSDFTAIS